MVMVSSALLPIADGNVDIERWLKQIETKYDDQEIAAIRRACAVVQADFDNDTTPIKLSGINYGLEIANVLFMLNQDADAVTAGILYPTLLYSEISVTDLDEQFAPAVLKLLKDGLQMDSFGDMQKSTNLGQQIDNFRRMLLAMVDDTRLVLLKLAERVIFMRHIANAPKELQEFNSTRSLEVFAPLANRLGIMDIKWELEDLSFQCLQPKEYKAIARQLNERRIDRERFVQQLIGTLKNLLGQENIQASITGRAKHIYSIYRKMQRKEVGYDEIYDNSAIRVVVKNIEDCYKTLSIMHSHWQHVPHEFDDYIATPKANGYQSIHTVITPENRNVEIQIRTQQMHNDNELGGAAHWMYKEGNTTEKNYQNKIIWLRQLLDWQREMADSAEIPEEIKHGLTESRVYVFTPEGSVISLPKGATPLDFAYHVHTEIGHKCRGAKVNEKMVPLTYQLNLGDRIEILTGKEANPSRDWLNPQQGYLISSRAKAKIHSWFKKRDFDKNMTEGQSIFQRELKRFNLTSIDPEQLADRFHLKNANEVLAAIGAGDIRMPQLSGALQECIKKQQPEKTEATTNKIEKKSRKQPKGILVEGVTDLLTSIAYCCKPIPGESITGYVTVGRGITIHRNDCKNVLQAQQEHPDRLVTVSWGDVSKQNYVVDLVIEANNRPNLLRDLTKIISDESINIIGLNSYVNHLEDRTVVNLSIETTGHDQLIKIQNHLQSVENIISVKRQ